MTATIIDASKTADAVTNASLVAVWYSAFAQSADEATDRKRYSSIHPFSDVSPPVRLQPRPMSVEIEPIELHVELVLCAPPLCQAFIEAPSYETTMWFQLP